MHSTIAIHLFPGLRLATLLLALLSTAWGGQAPVYRVLSEGRAPSYLVGTMHSEDPRVLAVLTPLAIGHIPAMTVPLALLFLASGLASAAGNMLLLIAYRLGSGTALAPLVYFQLIAAVGLGWAVFGDLPDTISWAGMAVIVGAGLLSARLARGSFTPLRADRA